MRRRTTETEERRMDCICRRLRQRNNIRKTKTHTDSEKNRLDIFVDTSLSPYAAVSYLNGEFTWRRTDLPQ